MSIFYLVLLILLSILAMGKGSDWFTESIIPVARKFHISRISVGSILVSAAVSLPEILVAVYAGLKGHLGIGLGVTLGSIICNIGMMTGLSAIIQPLKVSTKIILRDGIFSIIVPILVFATATRGEISRLEGFAFFLLFIPYVVNTFMQDKQFGLDKREDSVRNIEIELQLLGFDFGKLRAGIVTFIIGLALLLGGAQLFSNQLIAITDMFKLNELLVGLTIGAIGPSIPNIIAAYKATKKGMGDVAVTETLGSNIFTLLVTLGILAMLSPITIAKRWLWFDIPSLIAMSFLLFIFMISKKTITRLEGVILVTCYLLILIGQIILSI